MAVNIRIPETVRTDEAGPNPSYIKPSEGEVTIPPTFSASE
jgi:hypothetical protein